MSDQQRIVAVYDPYGSMFGHWHPAHVLIDSYFGALFTHCPQSPVHCRPMLRLLLTWLLLIAVACAPSAAYAVDDEDRTIRVRLLDNETVTHATLSAENSTLRVATPFHDNPLFEVEPGDELDLGTRSDEVYVRNGSGEGAYATALRLQPATDDGQWTLTPDGGSSRTYGGDLLLRPDPEMPDRLQFINRVPLEPYVAAVVASEYTLDDAEGAKAMAVVARTYALQGSSEAELDYEHVDHVISQVYRGASSITDEARQAARATRGEVLTHDDDFVQAVYFSSSGGHTADNEDVWDADPRPYLRGQDDPYDAGSPHQNWRATAERDALIRALSDHYDLDLLGFEIADRNADGRVQDINLLVRDRSPERISANTFRLIINEHIPNFRLKSTLFEATREGDRYIFEGSGHGHGVGLNQWGAHEMAQRGYSYREILSFYYTDVTLDHLDDTEAPAIALDDQPSETSTEPDTTQRRIGW